MLRSTVQITQLNPFRDHSKYVQNVSYNLTVSKHHNRFIITVLFLSNHLHYGYWYNVGFYLVSSFNLNFIFLFSNERVLIPLHHFGHVSIWSQTTYYVKYNCFRILCLNLPETPEQMSNQNFCFHMIQISAQTSSGTKAKCLECDVVKAGLVLAAESVRIKYERIRPILRIKVKGRLKWINFEYISN